MNIASPAFSDGTYIPFTHAKRGDNIRPPLRISDVPSVAASLAIICHDPDAPRAEGFTHWVAWNIPPDATELDSGDLPAGSIEGRNDAGVNGWVGPEPPSGIHRYMFYLYALDTVLELPLSTDRVALEAAMQGHAMETAKLTGLFGARGAM